MPKVIGVRFRTSPRIYYFAPTEGEEYVRDTKIVVETQRGIELATVIMPVTEVDESKIVAPLKGIMRIATDADIEAASVDATKRQEILSVAKQKVSARGLDMKIIDCEFTVDHGKLVLYFTAEQRVDFRELVRDLASAFHIRIDLRQIGAREECKLIGSLGVCGMPCCCGRFESDSEHVSIKMAKCQNLALTPNKINGMCGRLLCCLSYENATYEDVARRSPRIGAYVNCPDGRRGTVVSVIPLAEKVRVRIGDEENFEFCEYSLGEINSEKRDIPHESSQDLTKDTDNDKQADDGKDVRADKADNNNGTRGGNNKNRNHKDNRNNNNRDNKNSGNRNSENRNNNNSNNGGGNGKKKNHKKFNKQNGKGQPQ